MTRVILLSFLSYLYASPISGLAYNTRVCTRSIVSTNQLCCTPPGHSLLLLLTNQLCCTPPGPHQTGHFLRGS